ncbi:MAG: type III-I CRISPR-associated gRAMP effector Cas7-11i [Ardenticatenaceae bacterium]
MILRGELIAESPIYRGNARKTLFTRDGDGTQRLVSLAGEISGTAQSLMDAFIGESRNRRNVGLLNRLWLRLYAEPMPKGLITKVNCQLQKDSYLSDRFFDLRMGIKLDEDRWAAEANANYKMETLMRNSVFDFSMEVNESRLKRNDNDVKLYYLLEELKVGDFWFGAGKSKGLGRCRLEMDWPLRAPQNLPQLSGKANQLTITLSFDAMNPVLVGWNWGKVDPDQPAFTAVEGQVLIQAMRSLPKPIRTHLQMVLSGPILNAEDWKLKFAEYLPRSVAIWLRKNSQGKVEAWTLPPQAINKLGKGKYRLPRKALSQLNPLIGKAFTSQSAAKAAIEQALANNAKMSNRVLKSMTRQTQGGYKLNKKAWLKMANFLGLDPSLADALEMHIQDEAAVVSILNRAVQPILPQLYQQIDQQINLLQSDSWVDAEVGNRGEHLQIKEMLYEGKINEGQWNKRNQPPKGVTAAAWQEFQESHNRVRFRHLLHPKNLQKSITNDKNAMAFLKNYRLRTRQELSQPHHIDFRPGGMSNREIGRKYGKPYDTIFMRMLSWSPSTQRKGGWEVYIPGSTIKGAFRKRGSQVLKTVWGESRKTDKVIDRLFGKQGQIGLVFFSDAYLMDPRDPERAWCSMDGVKMDPNSGMPIETAKSDYLYAYGDGLVFQLRLDLHDIDEYDGEAISLLCHLVEDFQGGDIPLGGEKTSGLGWVEAQVDSLKWKTSNTNDVGQWLFEEPQFARNGIWQEFELEAEDAVDALNEIEPLLEEGEHRKGKAPPRAPHAGFISHRAFGGHCGRLEVEVEILTPTMVRESGQPSFSGRLADGAVHGWDFFSMSPAEAAKRNAEKAYALPSKSLRGMIRHLYTIASDSAQPSSDISRLNPADSLFGWVGHGRNQAITGRVSVGFGQFEAPELGWFKIPYPYGDWHYKNGVWQQVPNGFVPKLRINNTWRLFSHAPLAPIVQPLDDFQPDVPKAYYGRAVMPGSRAYFTIRFWNLENQELQRLIWCLMLEPNLAHKMGKNRYLGFGSLRLKLLPDSYLTDWGKRYAGELEDDWQLPIDLNKWNNPNVIKHHQALRKALNAEQL